MKRKPAGSNHKAIETFLMDGSASAIDIKRATKVKGNIYQNLEQDGQSGPHQEGWHEIQHYTGT
jgi:hypothetical protein